MINFIVCDDNKVIRSTIEKIILEKMINNQLGYKTYLFDDYNENFVKIVNDKIGYKIYILDIETPSASGIDMARLIRKKDLDSIIIFLTSHEELGYLVLKNEFMFLSFISKFDDYENRLDKAISKSIKLIGKTNYIKLEDHGIIYTIPLDEILFITKDSIDRKTIIKTDYTEFKLNKPLTEFSEILNSSFKQTHRACIINMDRVRIIDKKKKKIYFDNGMTCDLLSDNFKRGIKNE